MYANECAEIRKVTQVVIRSQLALEQVCLRLETIEDLGNILVSMAPVVGVIRETRGSLRGILPEVASELGEVNEMLNDTILEAGVFSSKEMDIGATEEAQKIIREANTVAEQRMKERFPELPTALPRIPEDLQDITQQGP
jgi:division protein CdvB (Snf7/Vps24/ESCRT-III family)